MLKYENFLAEFPNAKLREEYWAACCRCEGYFSSFGFNGKVEKVTVGDACFHGVGEIRISVHPHEYDRGALFHEMTHDLFHHSVFHSNSNPINSNANPRNGKSNEDWGEAFCEAVRYLMEYAYTGDSDWLRQFAIEIKYRDSDKGRAGRILDAAGSSLAGFATLWKEITMGFDKTEDYLNRRFSCS